MPFERNPQYQELARRLCAAYVSYTSGVSITTGYKNTPDDVGDLWYWLADLAAIAATANMDEMAKRLGLNLADMPVVGDKPQ